MEGDEEMTIEFLDWTINFHSLGIAVFKIALSLVCAGVIGIERGRKKRPAGKRKSPQKPKMRKSAVLILTVLMTL